MFWKRLGCLILIAALLVPLAGAVEVSAKSAALYDPSLNRFLYTKNENEPLPMASTTKIMTALLALETLPLDREITVTPQALRTEGSSMYLTAGERVTVEELLYGLLLLSGNDAAKVLALACSGSEEEFVRQMNQKAQELGLQNTHFENPHGLPAEGHFSTAADMAKLMAACLENEDFCTISGTKLYAGRRTMKNHNKLLSLYPEAISGKTGFTKAAGRCLVSAAEQEGGALIAVTLSAPDDWNDHISLYDYGFSAYPMRRVLTAAERRMTLPVQSGASALCTLRAERDLRFRLTEREVASVTETVLAPSFLYAPVEKYAPLGELVLTLEGKELARVPLRSESAVPVFQREKTFWEKCSISFKKIANRLGLW